MQAIASSTDSVADLLAGGTVTVEVDTAGKQMQIHALTHYLLHHYRPPAPPTEPAAGR